MSDFNRPLDTFEELMVFRIFCRRGFGISLLQQIFGKSRPVLTRILNRRKLDGGGAGLDITLLDINQDYLDAERPAEYQNTFGFSAVSALVDGKCYKMDSFRKNSKLNKAQHCPKVHMSALLNLNWQSPSGLSFEHDPVHLGRSTEGGQVRLRGSVSALTPEAAFVTDELDRQYPVQMLPMVEPTTSIVDDFAKFDR
jgi:hypothetical protein